jgi:hypothetical protein
VFMFGLVLWALDPDFQFLFSQNWYVLVKCRLVDSGGNKFILKTGQKFICILYVKI